MKKTKVDVFATSWGDQRPVGNWQLAKAEGQSYWIVTRDGLEHDRCLGDGETAEAALADALSRL